MKKKGFTLVELLAVIVILAIIALIAIPLIGNVIEKAKIGALESSVNGLIESANMYYANNTIKGETVTETIFDFEDGEQVSDKKLEYKGKVYNGKLILHANGEVAVCIDDEEHYAYKNKDADEIVSGNGTCLYNGTTGDFSSNSSINDLRGKTLVATQIEENGDNALITIPEEGHVDTTSKISVPIENIKEGLNNVLGFDQFISWYDGVKGWVTSDDGTFTVTNNGDWILFDSSKKIHFVACKKSQKKIINFSVSGYNNCFVDVSNDGITWTNILAETISTTNVGNYNHNGNYSYTIPDEYSSYTYIRLRSGWDSAYQLWYTATVNIE